MNNKPTTPVSKKTLQGESVEKMAIQYVKDVKRDYRKHGVELEPSQAEEAYDGFIAGYNAHKSQTEEIVTYCQKHGIEPNTLVEVYQKTLDGVIDIANNIGKYSEQEVSEIVKQVLKRAAERANEVLVLEKTPCYKVILDTPFKDLLI